MSTQEQAPDDKAGVKPTELDLEQRADALWAIGSAAITDVWAHGHDHTSLMSLRARCTLSGIFRMLAVSRQTDTSRALRLKLITYFPVDLQPDERISLEAYISRLVSTGSKALPGIPAENRKGWELLSRLVERNRLGPSSTTRALTRTVPMEAWEHYATIARELPAHKAVSY